MPASTTETSSEKSTPKKSSRATWMGNLFPVPYPFRFRFRSSPRSANKPAIPRSAPVARKARRSLAGVGSSRTHALGPCRTSAQACASNRLITRDPLDGSSPTSQPKTTLASIPSDWHIATKDVAKNSQCPRFTRKKASMGSSFSRMRSKDKSRSYTY